ncbi:MAG: hypothetical protein U9P49_01465 [Thermodesulfobacteriota bacterium]|nr:hypothetical protein [Thermodesulfobacteriota bacterium]
MKEKEKKNYLAMWDGGRGAERNPTNYSRRDDGNHIYKSDEYYEWWYFDASFDNSYNMVVTFHYSNVFLRPMIPTVQLMIYKPDGTQTARYALCNKDEIYACPEYCDVKMADSWAKDTGDGYELYMKIKGVGAHLIFKNIVPGWKPGTGFLYKDEEVGLVSGWVVPVPHAEVEGELYIKDETIKVKGTGYHDHNWGNCRSYKTFQGWYWGRIHSEKYSLDYGWVLPRDKEAPVVSPLLLARDGEIVLSTDMMHTRLEDFVKDEKTNEEYAKKLTVTSDVKGVNLLLTINTHRVIESMQLPKVADWDQFYYRFLGDYEMNIEVDGVKDHAKGELLHELMIL